MTVWSFSCCHLICLPRKGETMHYSVSMLSVKQGSCEFFKITFILIVTDSFYRLRSETRTTQYLFEILFFILLAFKRKRFR